jgi:hypothetical protein
MCFAADECVTDRGQRRLGQEQPAVDLVAKPATKPGRQRSALRLAGEVKNVVLKRHVDLSLHSYPLWSGQTSWQGSTDVPIECSRIFPGVRDHFWHVLEVRRTSGMERSADFSKAELKDHL